MMSGPLFIAALDYSSTLKFTFYGLLAAGFVIAVVVGSIAWYNSKKPPGWEGADKPNWVPNVDAKDKTSSESDQSGS